MSFLSDSIQNANLQNALQGGEGKGPGGALAFLGVIGDSNGLFGKGTTGFLQDANIAKLEVKELGTKGVGPSDAGGPKAASPKEDAPKNPDAKDGATATAVAKNPDGKGKDADTKDGMKADVKEAMVSFNQNSDLLVAMQKSFRAIDTNTAPIVGAGGDGREIV